MVTETNRIAYASNSRLREISTQTQCDLDPTFTKVISLWSLILALSVPTLASVLLL